MNPFYEEWLAKSNQLIPAIISTHLKYSQNAERSPAGHAMGMAFVGTTWVVGIRLAMVPHPYAKTAGAALIAFPDWILYPAGYYVVTGDIISLEDFNPFE